MTCLSFWPPLQLVMSVSSAFWSSNLFATQKMEVLHKNAGTKAGMLIVFDPLIYLMIHPKNHGISKLVVGRSQNPFIQSQNPSTWKGPMILRATYYGCFRKWWHPQTPQNDHFLAGKPMDVGYHYFRKPSYITKLSITTRSLFFTWVNGSFLVFTWVPYNPPIGSIYHLHIAYWVIIYITDPTY